MYNQIAIQPQHIKSCNPSPTHHPVGVGLHARPRGLSGHLTLTSIIQLPYTNTPTSCSRGQADRQTDRQTDSLTDRPFILINHSSFAIKMSRPNINTPNSDLVSSLSQSQSYLSPNFLVILPGLTSSVRLCGVERCPAQQSEEEEERRPYSILNLPCLHLASEQPIPPHYHNSPCTCIVFGSTARRVNTNRFGNKSDFTVKNIAELLFFKLRTEK